MINEFEVPNSWSRWTKSQFQGIAWKASCIGIAYHAALYVSAEARGAALAAVTLISIYAIALPSFDKYRDKLHGTDPDPDTRHILRWLPYKPYEDIHEKITDSTLAQRVDEKWDDLVKGLS